MAKKKLQYLWEQEVESISGNTVTFKDWSETVLTDKQLTYIITDEALDATKLRDLVTNNMVSEILLVIEEHDLRWWDIDNVIERLVNSLNAWFSVALWKAFWTFVDGKPHQYFKEDIRPSHIKKVLQE